MLVFTYNAYKNVIFTGESALAVLYIGILTFTEIKIRYRKHDTIRNRLAKKCEFYFADQQKRLLIVL